MAIIDSIDLNPNHLATVKSILAEHVPECEVRAFGSRATWTAKDYSDLDLAIVGEGPLDRRTLGRLKEAFEESDLPMRVDVLDWHSISESFRGVIERGSEVIQPGSNHWLHCTLADACSAINYGLTASASSSSVGPKFLRITDIVRGHIDWNDVPHVDADADVSEKYRLYDGDIVIARTGASTGTSAYVKDPPPSVFASYLVRLQARPGFDPRFLAYLLKSDMFVGYIHGVLGDKSAQPNASASTMTAAPITVPQSKAEQRAIAHVLGTLDDKIELNRRMNETLEEMARALFKSWFVDFDPIRAKIDGRWQPGESLPGLPADLYDLFPDRLVDSELGKIPEGWEVGEFGDVVTRLRDTESPANSPEALFSHFSIPAYDEGQNPIEQLGQDIKSSKSRVSHDGVLLSKLNPEIERVWLVDVTPHERAICSTEFLVLRASPPFQRMYVYCLVRSPQFRGQMESLVTGTSKSHQRAPANATLALRALIPPVGVIEAFEILASESLGRCVDLRRESRILASLREVLLPMLVSGYLRVEIAEEGAGSNHIPKLGLGARSVSDAVSPH